MDDLNGDLNFITVIDQQFWERLSYFGHFELEKFEEYFYCPNRRRLPKNHFLCGFAFVKIYFSLASVAFKYSLNPFYSAMPPRLIDEQFRLTGSMTYA